MSRTDKTSRFEQQIEENLRRAYDDVAKEAVPDRFTDLMRRLREAEAKGSSSEAKDDA